MNKDSFEMTNKWLAEIKTYTNDIKIILVGNKCDKFDYQVNIEDAKKLAYDNDSSYLSSSALDNKNIKEIFMTLANGIYITKIEIYHYNMKKDKENIIINKRKSIRFSNKKEEKKGCC